MATSDADRYVLGFEEIDRGWTAVVGGKGANLGDLSHIAGIKVPKGFCVTTSAFERFSATAPALAGQLDRLALLDLDERATIRTLSAAIRETIATAAVPQDLAEAVTSQITRLGSDVAYAVRSSAPSEDSPTVSFAGQLDSFLNVKGESAIKNAISRCWASAFTERAVTYRLRNGIDLRRVQMAVVVQHMVVAEAAGVVFTADPVTSNRKVLSLEATVGLGEALVSGLVDADAFKVRDGAIVEATVATKRIAVRPSPNGGTHHESLDTEHQRQPALTDAQVLHLASLARRIEDHFGAPQDIEWCLVDGEFQFVQSRPITTLFPVPERDDAENHVYVSVGHGQMMTDPMRPLGLSMWKLTALPPMHVAGGRLFVDVTERLASPASRAGLLAVFGRGDPLIKDALQTVLDRPDFLPPVPDEAPAAPPPGAPPASIDTDPAVVAELIARSRVSIASLEKVIGTKSGTDLLDCILQDIPEMKRLLFDPLSQQAIMAGMEATWWLNDQLQEWLGETNAADTLTRSAPNNITSEMGLDLLDVADVIRPHPDVVEFLRRAVDDDFLEDDALTRLEGGAATRRAILDYLDVYGMRCVGEIDITRPRWSEHPTALVPVILGNVREFEPGEARRRFERGTREAHDKEAELLERLHILPDGGQKAAETKRMIDRVRTFIGYREYPKYGMIARYFLYKRALLGEAERLVDAEIVHERDDVYYLTFEELYDVVRTQHADDQLIQRRRQAFESYHTLTPPRVLTSDGEAIAGSYGHGDVPPGALQGLAVSGGTVEGRARVILDMGDADVEAGDILVTAHTDPSWSPLFVAIAALVTEVGGLMTHGAVIAREYGLPAVVGVQHATRLIRDGQRIRVHGTEGYVEILP